MTLEAPLSPTEAQGIGADLEALVANVERVILGKSEAVRMCVVALLAEGHILLEDVPGTGKTTLARALARSVDVDFKRIQFTSDLLPADVLGLSVHSRESGRFEFQPGPIFANVVLADELNRTSPRTQSALLECMNEGVVTVDGEPHPLPVPFLVIATQNPLEFEGTYPLPESELDRFLLRLRLGYPETPVERDLLRSRLETDPMDSLGAVIDGEAVRRAREATRRVRVADELLDYALAFVAATRRPADFLLGASPRAALAWVRGAQALALVEGRDFALPDDFKRLCLPVLGHRVVPQGATGVEGSRASELALAELLDRIEVPI